jgi:hypothetical protein
MTKYLAYVVTALALMNAAVLLIEHEPDIPRLACWLIALCSAGLLWSALSVYRGVVMATGLPRDITRVVYGSLVTSGLILGLFCVALSMVLRKG